jgi:hypothetical protein
MIAINYQEVEVFNKIKTVDDLGAEKLNFEFVGRRKISHFRNIEDLDGLNNGYGSFESELLDFYSKEKFVFNEAIKRNDSYYVIEALTFRESINISYYHVVARLIRAS